MTGGLLGIEGRAKAAVRHRIQAQRRRPECAAVLNEPKANALWELGQKHEQEDAGCCAYWVYRQAARLLPAPSARRAQQRVTAMEQDPELMAQAEACRRMQECHRLYERAERIAAVRPERAEELWDEVVRPAPPDTPLWKAARDQLDQLARRLR